MKISLIGFMGSGKSTVGRLIAGKLNIKLIEMDELLLELSGFDSINEIFEKHGETRFRELEIDTAKTLAKQEDCVISTGGGVVMNKIIIDYLKKSNDKAIVVFLNTKFETLSERLEGDTSRPLFQNTQKAKNLYDFRLPLYEEYADAEVTTDNKPPEKIAAEIIDLITKNL